MTFSPNESLSNLLQDDTQEMVFPFWVFVVVVLSLNIILVFTLQLFSFCESLVHPVFSFSLDSFKLWTNHPAFGVAKITFCLALGLGIILTIWLHLPYIPGLQKLSFFSWIGTVMSFCEGAL